MNFAAAIGLGNDQSLKQLQKLNRNFGLLFQAKASHEQKTLKVIELQNTTIKRMMQDASRAYDNTPYLSDSGEGLLKDIKEDDNKMLALLLGGGLLAGALMMGSSILNSLKDFFGDVEEKVLEEMDLDDDSESSTATPPSSVSPTTTGSQTSTTGLAPTNNKPYAIAQSIGFNKKDWDIYRNVVGDIESGNVYDIAGGSGNHYDGRWQLGAAAKTDAARYLGETNPGHGASGRQRFRQDAAMQERFFAAFTAKNHEYLSSHPKYKNASTKRKFEILGYAHNQGAGNARKWLTTGRIGRDGFGTKGTRYSEALKRAYGMQTGGLLGNVKGAVKNILGLGKDKKGGKGEVPDFSNSPLKGNYLTAYQEIKRHFPEAQAHHIAAAMGNFDTEAPGLKPNTYQGSKGKPLPGKPGRGLAQWEVPHKGNPTGRWAVAEKMHGKEIFTSLKKQLEFFAWEMKTGSIITEGPHKGDPNLPRGRDAKGMWLNAPDLKSATEGFMVGYEAPGTPHWDKRLKGAQRIHQQILQHQKMFPGHKTGGFVMPKAKTPKINITPEPPAKLQRGGSTQAMKLSALHTPSFVGAVQARRQSRSVIVIKTKTKMIPVSPPSNEKLTTGSGDGRHESTTMIAKRMYRVQKGAFT